MSIKPYGSTSGRIHGKPGKGRWRPDARTRLPERRKIGLSAGGADSGKDPTPDGPVRAPRGRD